MAFDPAAFRQIVAEKERKTLSVRPQHETWLPTMSDRESHDEAMDVDAPEDASITSQIPPRIKSISRPPSWNSEELPSQHTGDRSSGLSRAVSVSDNHSTTTDEIPIGEKRADDPAFHAAYRLFKASVKQASEIHGPFLPPDDGSPFLAHRLHRLWQDLSSEQRLVYYARAATESNQDSIDASHKLSPPYSPLFQSANGGSASAPSIGVGSMRTYGAASPHDTPELYHTNPHTPDLRSPVSFVDDDLAGSVRSRSQSPSIGDEGRAHGSHHVPRPPNAWILFRSTMSKTRRPDGVVYSPPEISLMWKNLDSAERDIWFERAKEAKQQHEVDHPGYKYRPNRTKASSTRKLQEGPGGGSYSGSRSSHHRTHPPPSPPPWHTRV